MKEICMQVEDERRHADQFKEQVCWHCTSAGGVGLRDVIDQLWVLTPVAMHAMQRFSERQKVTDKLNEPFALL